VSVRVEGNEIVLIGTVGGDPWWDGDVFSQGDVLTALAQVGRNTDVTVRVNSGGGVATEGAALHATFAAHKGRVDMVVEGWAASAASLFIMAGTTITMRPGALLMIHEPAAGAWGSAAEHQRTAAALDVMAGVYADVYADRCGKSAEEVRALMKAETWLGPEEAVAQGFADAVDEAGDAGEPVAFAQVRAYAHAPERITMLAKSRGWGAPAVMAAPSAPVQPTMETPVPGDDKTTDTPAPAATPPAPAPAADTPADAVAIAEACEKAGFTMLTTGFLRGKATMKDVTAKLADAHTIAAACDSLRVPAMKDSLVKAVASGVDLQAARDMATNAAAARDEAIRTDTTQRPAEPTASSWAGTMKKLRK